MPTGKSKVEAQREKDKLSSSYKLLLDEFSSKDLRHVGNYTLDKLIGKGSFGKVYLAKHNLTNGTKVVLKSSKKDDSNLAREIHHHRQFLHPHIARLYEVIVTESLVWLVLEYCPGDELYSYLLHHGALSIPKVQKIFAQLVGAVAYIHNKSCVHRDLKLENVLLDKNENVKLCDFGFTREYEGKASYLQTFCGTVCYSAPEMLKGEKYAGEKVDVWSLGIILYALIRGELPFDEDDDMATKAKILTDEPPYPEGFPEDAKSLISKLLSKRPLLRPTLSEVLADPFLSEHAPQQQAILKLAQPAPFTTPIEKSTLERMKSAGVNIDQVIENVLSQRCDTLAGWWALMIEKEERKEIRRERKRKEREADMKLLRRLSGASGRLDLLSSGLLKVEEEGHVPDVDDPPRSSSRGRRQRRSTPHILVTDLPRLPEGSAVTSPGSATPPPPLDKDSVRSPSTSRPPPPPKEHSRTVSNLQIVSHNPELLGPPGGILKRRSAKRQQGTFLHQLASLKQWLVDSTKRSKSPNRLSPTVPGSKDGPQAATGGAKTNGRPTLSPVQTHHQTLSQTTAETSSLYAVSVTTRPGAPGTTQTDSTRPSQREPMLDSSRVRPPRNSLSPSPLTPHTSYRRGSGLRGRKSTSSSVSSIRSMPRQATHSKASSASSNSLETLHSPGSRSAARSPHSSIKVLPATPTVNTFSTSLRLTKVPSPATDALTKPSSASSEGPAATLSPPPTSVVFARRKKSAFKGPVLNGAFFGLNVGGGLGSPALRPREGSDGRLNMGLRDITRSASGRSRTNRRKSQIIEEEEEEDEENEEAVEEVDAFEPIDLARGERVHSITVWDDGHERGSVSAQEVS